MVDSVPLPPVRGDIREKLRRWQADCFEEFVKSSRKLKALAIPRRLPNLNLDVPLIAACAVLLQSFRAQAEAQARELLHAIDAAEGVIVSTIERECEALRAGRMLAAKALRLRLRDAAKLYLDATRAARASIWTIEQLLPGTETQLANAGRRSRRF